MTKTYIEYLFPGSLFSESQTKVVASRDCKPRSFPKGCFGYRFFDRQEMKAGAETLYGANKNYSGTTYLVGPNPIYDVERVKREIPDSDILQGNMRCNGWDKIVRTIRGNYQPLLPKDSTQEI